jgi:hypothetical protein
MFSKLIRGATAIAVLATLSTPAVRAQGFGDMKGQVIWTGAVPARAPLKVDKDQDACLAHGPLLSENLVVDPKSKGVRWVMVWLVKPDATTVTQGPPVNPALRAIAPKDRRVTIDQPNCQFEPHVLGIRTGQELVVKNSAKVPHNTNIIGGASNPNINNIIPPGKSEIVKGFKASAAPISVACTIHGWMKGYVFVFNHPYFAVTDADGNFEIKGIPAGTWHYIVWQEEKGWDATPGGKKGTPVKIEASGAADVGKIEMKP